MAAERHVAFIRAIMIGRNGLHREVVLDLFRAAGAGESRNHLATGNVSFTADAGDVAPIVARVEAGIEVVAGRPKPLYVRTLDHLARMRPPLVTPADGATLEVAFLPAGAPMFDLPLTSRSGRTAVFARAGDELWATSVPNEAPGVLIERAVGAPVTIRAWTTIEKILAAH